MTPAFRTNPVLSFWLSSANAWAGTMRGLWMAEFQRQQAAFLTQAARQATLFWTGRLPQMPARSETAASPAPIPATMPAATPPAALRVIESQAAAPPEPEPDLKAPAPAPSALAVPADDGPPSEPATPPAPEGRPTGGRALATRAERRSSRHSSGKRRPR
ncbi:MAG: hypothetical protein QJR07_19790 [Acetobacteraceae bacterium]|nr:hypothetical protein [Acetobacteraceae bacterium]